jgi:energy-coupling factor transport system ATP-binding protein
MTPGAPPAILVEGLSVRYDGEQTPALRSIDLTVRPGERILLLGPSGSGKSTFALCLNGIIPRSVGAVVEGRIALTGSPIGDVATGELCRRVGVLFQDPETQFCMLNVEDEVAFGLENLAVPPSEMPARIGEALWTVGLGGLETRRGDQLSGGMKQRLALACLLAMDPDVLVLDEPTANLDPAGTRSVFDLIRELVEDRRRVVIIIEHKLDQCVDLVDRVVVLDPTAGILVDGPPWTVFRDHAERLDAVGIWQPTATRLARRLEAAGGWCGPYPLTIAEAVTAFAAAGVGPDAVMTIEPPASTPQPQPSPPALAIRDLTFSYGSQRILAGTDLTVPAGHVLAILGPNGAGKTTLIQLAAGLRRPPSDTVLLFGRDVRGYRPAELAATVGYVFQNPEHQFIRQTVYDELAFGLEILGCLPAEIRDRVDQLLTEFGLVDRRWANPFSLSQGEKRRLSVATQLMSGQQLLVFDEPTFGQDQATTTALMERIVGLQQQGKTIVMVSHDLQIVARYATLAAVLLDGRMQYLGPPVGLMNEPELLVNAALELPPAWAIARALQQEAQSSTTAASKKSVLRSSA